MRDRRLDPERFRARRQAEGLSTYELARRSGVSRSFIKYLEAGNNQPSDLYAQALATALNCEVDDFCATAPTAA
jgi:transcriptional regulator with XRE-family HTH domain